MMDVRSPLASIGLCAVLLMASGCSPSDEKKQATLEEKTAKFEQSLDNIQDPKLRDAIADLGGSLLLLERARVKLAELQVIHILIDSRTCGGGGAIAYFYRGNQ